MKHLKPAIFFILLLFLSGFVYAKTASEAISFVSQEKHLIFDNEKATIYPLAKITYENKQYWAVSVLSDDDLVSIIPVNSESLEIPSRLIPKTTIINIAYFFRLYDTIKSNAQKQGTWLFNLENEKFFADLSSDYHNETFEIESIKSEIPSSLYSKANAIKSLLNTLSDSSNELSLLISDIRKKETDFFSNPSPKTFSNLLSSQQSFFSKIKDLDNTNKDYLAKLNSLRLDIAKLNISAETKRSITAILNPPQKTNILSSKTNYALSLEESFDEAKTKADTDSVEIASSLSKRIKKGEAYSLMYAFDNSLFSQTNARSLKQLVEEINSPTYKEKWENQDSLKKMNEYWKKAEIYYNRAQYEEAVLNAKLAKKKALSVYNSGIKTSSDKSETPWNIIILLALVLIAVFIYQNRSKLGIGKKEDDSFEEDVFSN